MAKKKNYLPKRIAGVKIPKTLRRGVLGEFLTSAAGQALIAALIMKAAQRLRDEVAHASHVAGPASPHADGAEASWTQSAAHAGNQAAATAHDATLNVKHALAQAARHFLLGLSHPKSPKKKHRHAPAPAYAPDRDQPYSRDSEASRSGPDELAAHPH